jgi:hypothetical protein
MEYERTSALEDDCILWRKLEDGEVPFTILLPSAPVARYRYLSDESTESALNIPAYRMWAVSTVKELATPDDPRIW